MPRLADIKFRKETAANWSTVNPVLNEGEPGIETDTLKMKVGNGTSSWNSLDYVGAGTAQNSLKYAGRALYVQASAPTTGMANGDIWIKI